MKRKILEKLFDIRSNNTNVSTLIDDSDSKEFLESLIDGIKRYSKFLQKAQLVAGDFNVRYIFKIEDTSGAVELLDTKESNTRTDIVSKWECDTKTLGLGIWVPRRVWNFYEYYKDSVEDTLKNILYKPFVRCIEKNVVTGTYFDKSLFSAVNTMTGTKDFDGLLQLVRGLKNTTDDGCIIGSTAVINEIIDTIGKESYLNEYLLKGTIEGVPILSSVNYPDSVDDKFLVGFDPNKICLLLIPQLEVRKLNKLGSIDYFFQIFGFVNGGDIFNSAIAMKE
jgi:hypothetical protein